MYQPISFIGLVNGLHHLSFPSQVMSHDLTSFDSISFCPACKWGSLSISTSFYTNARYVMWTYCFNIDDIRSLNVVTMVVSWLTFAIWCSCFGLLTMSERPNHCLYGGGGGGGGGVWLTTYVSLIPLIILPKRFFSPAMVKDSLLVFCVKFCSRTFGIFYTEPTILMSWYYLSPQISEAAPLPPVFCKFQ